MIRQPITGVTPLKAICSCQVEVQSQMMAAYREAIKGQLPVNIRAIAQSIKDEYIEKYGKWCVYLGPEDFYSSPYCLDCLKDLISLLEEIK